jgi:hypothetical protein
VRRKKIALAACVLATFVAATPAVAQVEPIATTGNPGTVTATTAQLNGVVRPLAAGSSWLFQVSLNPGFNWDTQSTPALAVPRDALEVVERMVTGLTPSSTYFYRVVVESTHKGHTVTTLGGTETLSTAATLSAYWSAADVSTVLAVKHDATTLPLSCQGDRGAGCKGKLTVKAAGRKAVCSSVPFSAFAQRKQHALKLRLSRGCLKLLSHSGRLKVHLSAVFTSSEPAWTDSAYLVR